MRSIPSGGHDNSFAAPLPFTERAVSSSAALRQYIRPDAEVDWESGPIAVARLKRHTRGLQANTAYFNQLRWAKAYFDACHRSPEFRSRWLAATGTWDDKIVVDVGCGPGNLYATLGGKPALLIGIDVAAGALAMAHELGYAPLLADAQDLPLVSEFADLVAVNATLHHCDDMEDALAEAARLVKPGGMLVVDHDPHLSAWDFRGLAKVAWRARLYVYRWIGKGFHASTVEQAVALESEVHHEPGRGVTPEMLNDVLRTRGFDVSLYFHNHRIGSAALEGERGRAAWIYRCAQVVSGIDPESDQGALSIMCVARRA